MHHIVLLKLLLVFSQQTCTIHFFRPKTKFLGGFARFRCREVPVVRSGFGVHKMHHIVLPKLRFVFLQRTCPIHFFRPKTMFLGGFARFRCREVPCEVGFCGAYNAPLYATEVASCFFATNMPNPLQLAKLCFWVVSFDSVAGRYPL